MGKLFWVACGIVLLASIGLWAFGHFTAGAEAAEKEAQAKLKKDKLAAMADDVRKAQADTPREAQADPKLVTARHLAAQKEYTARLAAEEKSLLAAMGKRDVRQDFEPPPPSPERGVAAFREWLEKQYAKRNEIYGKAGIERPGAPERQGDVVNWGTLSELPRDEVLRKLFVSFEVARAIEGARAEIKYPNREGEGVSQTVETVVALQWLRFPEGITRGRRPGRRGAAAAAKAGQKAGALTKEHKFTVEMLAHHSVALDAVRRLEKSEGGLFVVRSWRVERCTGYESLPPEADAARRRKWQRRRNSAVYEAPDTVSVGVALIEFPKARGVK